ncbi:LpqN/LpqT family lipoprotein [soil metagenome]
MSPVTDSLTGMGMAKAVWAATAMVGVLVPGCGSDGGPEMAMPAETSSAEAVTRTEAPSEPSETIADYLQSNGITQTLVKRGDPGVPTLNLPMPAGWKDVGADTPADAYGAIYLAEPAPADNPPAIIARMARLSGEVDQAKVLELAPNAVRNQPGYQGPEAGRPSRLSGFDAAEIAGTVDQNGQTVFVARKTVVIPGKDGIYLLALDAQGSPDQEPALMDAMSVIDAETTIEP